MGRDKGYGSGKSRSAANSASRRTQANSASLRKQGGARTAAARQSAAIENTLRKGPQLDPAMGLGVSTRVLRGAAAALSAAGNVARAQMATQRANVAASGRASARALAQARAAEVRFGNTFPQLPTSSTSISRNARTAGRQSTEAYPKSFDAIAGRAPRSVQATQKTPSAQNFYEGGRRYVDTRYTYDPITTPRRTQYDPRTGYAVQPKTITGPKPGAALNPTGARYAPPRKARGGQR
jgi:hypothetical protein